MFVKICSRLMFALCSQYTFDLFVCSSAPLFYSVSLNLSIKSSYTAALAYQIPGFYLFQKYCFISNGSSYFWNSSHIRPSYAYKFCAVSIYEGHPFLADHNSFLGYL